MIYIEWLNEILHNRMMWNAFMAWCLAQGIKLILHLIATKELDFHILKESGGMPSSHSAIICSVCTAIGKSQGFGSPMFALASVMAVIVMYDATGVRRATGEQGKVLKRLVEMMKVKDQLQTTLKEVLGHTPVEVFAGAMLGIFVGWLFY